jgi:hypothetical protein
VAEVHETFDGKQPLTPDSEANEDVRKLLEAVRESHPALNG